MHKNLQKLDISDNQEYQFEQFIGLNKNSSSDEQIKIFSIGVEIRIVYHRL